MSILPPSPTTDFAQPSWNHSRLGCGRSAKTPPFHLLRRFWYSSRTLDLEWHQPVAGVYEEDRHWIDTLLNEVGYVDAFRGICQNLHIAGFQGQVADMPNPGAWRTDLQLASLEVSRRVLAAGYVAKKPFDDRVPLIVDYDISVSDEAEETVVTLKRPSDAYHFWIQSPRLSSA